MKPISFDRGVLERHEDFDYGPLMPRPVDVWLPRSYQAGTRPIRCCTCTTGRTFSILPSHMAALIGELTRRSSGWVSTPASFHQSLSASGTDAQRLREFMPQEPVQSGALRTRVARFANRPEGKLLSDAYLEFLVRQVKPFVDATYCTLPERDHTFVMGSSMGGLISLYALERYPEVFGGTGCVSTHWPVGRNGLVRAMGVALPRAGTHRLYFDYGTANLDSQYQPYQQRMDDYVRDAGYRRGKDWLTLKFPGADHSECAWRARVHLPLQFLLDTGY